MIKATYNTKLKKGQRNIVNLKTALTEDDLKEKIP